jgi:hypothetical protein
MLLSRLPFLAIISEALLAGGSGKKATSSPAQTAAHGGAQSLTNSSTRYNAPGTLKKPTPPGLQYNIQENFDKRDRKKHR